MPVFVINDQYAFDGETIVEASKKFLDIHPYDKVGSIMPLTGYQGIIEYWTVKYLYEVFQQLVKQQGVSKSKGRRRLHRSHPRLRRRHR